MKVDLAPWLAMATLVVAVIGALASVIATRRFGNRRSKIQFSWDSLSLLASERQPEALHVIYGNQAVEQPNLVTLRLRNIGPRDVTSAHFDGSRPIEIELDASAMYGLSRTTHERETSWDSKMGYIRLAPTLLKRGDEWTAEAITQGRPKPYIITNPLIDTDTVDASDGHVRQEQPSGWTMIAAALSAIAILISAFLLGRTLETSGNTTNSASSRTACSAIISKARTASQQPSPLGAPTHVETTGGTVDTWSNYRNAGGCQGPTIAGSQQVQIACKTKGFKVADGNTYWYRITSAPWNSYFYASADAFYNNGQTSGSLISTPFVDPAVPNCQ